MAKQRMISTKFWSDNWVREKLNQLDRYLFLYFLTNEHTKICGIYELPLSSMSFETGFGKEELTDTMLERLEPKVYFVNGWIIMPNFPKHQSATSPKILAGIAQELATVPEEIKKKAIGYGYPMDSLSHINTNPNHNLNPNTNTNWFDEWWSLYPNERRVSKQLCSMKYLSGITEVEHKRRIAHLKEQVAQDRKWLAGYIPLTTTYMNQGRWDMSVEVETAGQVYKSKIKK